MCILPASKRCLEVQSSAQYLYQITSMFIFKACQTVHFDTVLKRFQDLESLLSFRNAG